MRLFRAIVVSFLLGGAAFPAFAAQSFIFGIGTHLMDAGDATDYPYVAQLGVNSVRDDALWEKAEMRKGQYKFPASWDRYVGWLVQNRIQPYLIVDYGNPLYGNKRLLTTDAAIQGYANYAAKLAEHYPTVGFFELWNEWSGRPEDYVKVLKVAYPAIKKSRSDAVVLVGGAGIGKVRNGWFKAFAAAGGLQYTDAVSVHPYVFCEPQRDAQGFLSLLQNLTDISEGKDIYITETGWPTAAARKGCSVSEEQAAQYLAGSYLVARCHSNTKGFWWYGLRDGVDAEKKDRAFGLYANSWREKRAAQVARKISSVNGELECLNPAQRNLSPSAMRYKLRGKELSFVQAQQTLLAQ